MKVGIITFTYGDNYGQRLQNVAVQELLKDYFSEVYTIKQIKAKISLSEKIKTRLKNIINGKQKNLKKRHEAFIDFDIKYISYYGKSISQDSMDSFPEDEFDFFVAGSDQIWSPYSRDVNDTMFLTFTEKSKRIALSPSIASDIIPIQLVDKYKSYFNGFDHLSTREHKGAILIKEVSGLDAEVFIDPTLLFDSQFWNHYILKPSIITPPVYAFCYFLGNPEDMKEVYRICSKYDLEIVNVMGDKKYSSLGPSEFLYLILNAKLVITDSYHGTIFSLIYKCPFIVCDRGGTSLNMNSRFETLFSKFGIINRQLYSINDNDIFGFDFNSFQNNLIKEKKRIRDFIENCMAK